MIIFLHPWHTTLVFKFKLSKQLSHRSKCDCWTWWARKLTQYCYCATSDMTEGTLKVQTLNRLTMTIFFKHDHAWHHLKNKIGNTVYRHLLFSFMPMHHPVRRSHCRKTVSFWGSLCFTVSPKVNQFVGLVFSRERSCALNIKQGPSCGQTGENLSTKASLSDMLQPSMLP